MEEVFRKKVGQIIFIHLFYGTDNFYGAFLWDK